jgi:hypothetical protein
MPSFFSSPIVAVASIVLFVIAAVALGAWMKHRKTRTLAFKNRFGSEYDRAVITHGSADKAEAKLAARETRVEALTIRELGATERDRFVTEWHTVQARFVDHPKTAVTEADDLINSLLVARGYPNSSFEQRAADVSVHYPRVMENYRIAHAIAVRPGLADASTEELRTAMIKYRDIFDDLLQTQVPVAAKSAAA